MDASQCFCKRRIGPVAHAAAERPLFGVSRPFIGLILKGMSGRRPSSRVWLRLCERIGCGHVFGLLARETNIPLALMLVRMALRPISKTRSLWRLPFSSGFRAVPLVHIASPSPSMRIALRRNLVPAEPAGFRPRPDGRRNGRLWSRAHRRIRASLLASATAVMSGRRPVVKGLVEALRTFRVRSCLRPVGAGNECPAGPDAGPHGSSPNQQNALVMAPALFLGLPSRSVGSHRFAVALDADRLAAKPRSC